MDIRSVGLSSFAKIAHEGLCQADLELGRTTDDKPVGYVSPRVKKMVETTTRELASLSSQTVDAFTGQNAINEPSPWNKRRESIGFGTDNRQPAVSDLEAARTIYDITSHALEMAAHKPMAVQIGIYQGTLLAVSAFYRMMLPTLGEAAQKLLEGKSVRVRTDVAALNASSAAAAKKPTAETKPAADATQGADAKPVAAVEKTAETAVRKKPIKISARTVDRGGNAIADAGVAALARAAHAIGDETAIALLGNPALSSTSRLAALAAVAPAAPQPTPAA